MKKTITILLAAVVMFSLLATSALADVMWEPENDDFYSSHRDDMEYVSREFYANSKSGYLEFFTKPGGDSLGFAKNKELFYVGSTWKASDGTLWGVAEYTQGDDGSITAVDYEDYDNRSKVKTGWLKMDDTIVKYDSSEFLKDNPGLPVSDADYSSKYGEKILFWTYPNSGELASDEGQEIDENFATAELYKDADGNDWARVDYFYGMKNFWVCLSKPMEKNLPVVDHEPQFYSAEADDPVPTENEQGLSSTTLAIILACAAVAISLFAIFISKKTKEKSN